MSARRKRKPRKARARERQAAINRLLERWHRNAELAADALERLRDPDAAQTRHEPFMWADVLR